MEKVQLNFVVDKEVKEKLRRRAAQEHRSMSAHLAHLIEQDAETIRVPYTGIVGDGEKITFWRRELPEKRE